MSDLRNYYVDFRLSHIVSHDRLVGLNHSWHAHTHDVSFRMTFSLTICCVNRAVPFMYHIDP